MGTLLISAQLLWGLVSVFFGILVLIFPKILNYLVALYLIISGLMMVIPALA